MTFPFIQQYCRSPLIPLLLTLPILLSSCAEQAPTDPAPPDAALELIPLSTLYSRISDPDRCDAGILADAERQKVLRYINEVRAAHGLSAVTYASEHDDEVMASALITAANDVLAHQPTTDLKCWSEEGFRGSDAGNLGWASRFDAEREMAFSSEYMVDLWWTDDGAPGAGHRRWVLNPFLTSIAFGRVDRPMTDNESAVSAATLWVINEEDSQPGASSVTVDFVAYPFESTPRRRFSSQSDLSFSAIVDKTDLWGNQDVDFSQAQIAVLDPSGTDIGASDIRRLDDGAGVPNVLVWRSPVETGVRYEVSVSGVRSGGQVRGYSWWFEVEE